MLHKARITLGAAYLSRWQQKQTNNSEPVDLHKPRKAQ
jgi:hypothetical protein